MSDEPKQPHFVHLGMRVDASSPEEAVEEFIEEVNRYGLRTWAYRVATEETAEPTLIYGTGKPVEPEEVGDGAPEAGDGPPPEGEPAAQ